MVLNLKDYRDDIHLGEVFHPGRSDEDSVESLVDSILVELVSDIESGQDYPTKRRLLRALLNTLPPFSLTAGSIVRLDRLLQLELLDKVIVESGGLHDQSRVKINNTTLAIWQGDITTLRVDAIVNAANNRMLGCFQPLHACIDNAIHSAAGVQLRDDCHIIMEKQGCLEPTGTVKATRAYNLPSSFVLHTVGPIVRNQVNRQNEADLSSSYLSCLTAGKEIESVRSLAFCGISTGVFGYPAEEAAKVALDSVAEALSRTDAGLDLVVFNVFSDEDRRIYEHLFERLE